MSAIYLRSSSHCKFASPGNKTEVFTLQYPIFFYLFIIFLRSRQTLEGYFRQSLAVNGVKFDRLAKRTVPKSGARKIPAKLQSSSYFL